VLKKLLEKLYGKNAKEDKIMRCFSSISPECKYFFVFRYK
jgi:hypothetical protein